MTKLEYTVRFTTPAFLGDADQNGRWRTPPFKALLRQWWRVAYAADHHFNVDVAEMRREEGLLFGNAWLSHRDGHRKSLVRLRLDRWDEGKQSKRDWGQQELERGWKVAHPEVPAPVGPLLYMGYGPLVVEEVRRPNQQRREYATVLKRNAAIQAGEAALFSVAYATTHADPKVRQVLTQNVERVPTALALMDRYGALGGRSRNGWGSFSLTAQGDTPGLASRPPSQPWEEAIQLDWPHAIGSDERGTLTWATEAFGDWKSLMRALAIVKIGLRTQLVFPNTAPPHPNVQPRHWLSYPITRHTTTAWNRNARLPNSLRFKARPDAETSGKLRGVIVHVPCLPPPEFRPEPAAIIPAAIISVWRAVHRLLDELTQPKDRRRYSTIPEARRHALKPHLDTVTLSRIPE